MACNANLYINELPRLKHQIKRLIGDQGVLLSSSAHEHLIACSIGNNKEVARRHQQLVHCRTDQLRTGGICQLFRTKRSQYSRNIEKDRGSPHRRY